MPNVYIFFKVEGVSKGRGWSYDKLFCTGDTLGQTVNMWIHGDYKCHSIVFPRL